LRVDDDVAYEPFWDEWLEAADLRCTECDGRLVYDSYDPIYQEVRVHCEDCGATDAIPTAPEPDLEGRPCDDRLYIARCLF